MLFIDYTNQLLKYFEEKKSANQLSPLLVNPTTAQIKKECLLVYADRIKKDVKVDEHTLRAFFGVPPEGKNFSYVMDKTPPDKFRPLQSLIKGKIKNPASENVELLAWLIDFTLQPFARAKEMEQKEENDTNTDAGNDEPKDVSIRKGGDVPNQAEGIKEGAHASIFKKKDKDDIDIGKWLLAIVLVLVILFAGNYFISQQPTAYGKQYTGECMTWQYDHYIKVPCSTKREWNRIILPYNEELMRSFKMITREDTITASSIGNIYYIKMKGKPQFYTQSGYHPVEVNRSLRVMSYYIYEKYLGNKKSGTKEVSSK